MTLNTIVIAIKLKNFYHIPIMKIHGSRSFDLLKINFNAKRIEKKTISVCVLKKKKKKHVFTFTYIYLILFNEYGASQLNQRLFTKKTTTKIKFFVTFLLFVYSMCEWMALFKIKRQMHLRFNHLL